MKKERGDNKKLHKKKKPDYSEVLQNRVRRYVAAYPERFGIEEPYEEKEPRKKET